MEPCKVPGRLLREPRLSSVSSLAAWRVKAMGYTHPFVKFGSSICYRS